MAAPEEALRTPGFIDEQFIHENRVEILLYCVKKLQILNPDKDEKDLVPTNWLYVRNLYSSITTDIVILRNRYSSDSPPMYMINHFICDTKLLYINIEIIQKQIENIETECVLYPFMIYEYRHLKPFLEKRLNALWYLVLAKQSRDRDAYWTCREYLKNLKDCIDEDNFWNVRLP